MSGTIRSLIESGVRTLRAAGLENPRFDAELLLASILSTTRTYLLTHPEKLVEQESESRFLAWLSQRAEHFPVQYLIGRQEFYGRDFLVDERVLIPRPETEILVETALRRTSSIPNLRFLDIGTGSGCIAVTLAAERPDSRGIATDIAADALALAQQNARLLGTESRLDFRLGAGVEPICEEDEPLDLIVSNPPYVAEGDPQVAAEVLRYEPHHAVFSGLHGMEVIGELLNTAGPLLKPKGQLILEIGFGQLSQVLEAALNSGWQPLSIQRDLAGIDRVVVLGTATREEGTV